MEPTIEIFVSLGEQAIYAHEGVGEGNPWGLQRTGQRYGKPNPFTLARVICDEGSDVLAASRKEVPEKDRKQRPDSKKNRDKLQQGHVGDALRSIYQQTVNEDIPDEFRDILGKLA